MALTPEQKANELIDKFIGNRNSIYSSDTLYIQAVGNAIKCVNEILGLKLLGKTDGAKDRDYYQSVLSYLKNK